MKMASLLVTFVTSLCASFAAMAQFTPTQQDASGYLNQAPIPPAYMSPQVGTPQTLYGMKGVNGMMRSRMSRMQLQQPPTFVGSTTVSGTTIIGGMVGSNAGDISVNIAPTFDIKTSNREVSPVQPSVAPAFGPPVPGAAAQPVAAAPTGVDIVARERKCSAKSTMGGIFGGILGAVFPVVGSLVGAAVGSAVVGHSC